MLLGSFYSLCSVWSRHQRNRCLEAAQIRNEIAKRSFNAVSSAAAFIVAVFRLLAAAAAALSGRDALSEVNERRAGNFDVPGVNIETSADWLDLLRQA